MENKINYNRAILLLVTGAVSVALSLWFGPTTDGYGFMIGYGYTALAGGLVGLIYTFYKDHNRNKQRSR